MDEVEPAGRVERILRQHAGQRVEHGEGRDGRGHRGGSRDTSRIAVRDHGRWVGHTAEEDNWSSSDSWRADPSRARTVGADRTWLAIYW